VRAPNSPEYAETKRLMRQYGLSTVCEEAACPNIGECWKHKHATFMIMGDTCTRACAFCNVATGKPGALNPHEPANIAEAVGKLGTRPCRGDVGRSRRSCGRRGRALRGGDRGTQFGAGHHDRGADARLHAQGRRDRNVVAARPDVFNHNLETVPRLYPAIRPGARYFTSLRCCRG
jgi:lipoic acid synthetase